MHHVPVLGPATVSVVSAPRTNGWLGHDSQSSKVVRTRCSYSEAKSIFNILYIFEPVVYIFPESRISFFFFFKYELLHIISMQVFFYSSSSCIIIIFNSLL